MQVSRTIELPARIEEAWGVLADWERQADWMRDADRVEVLTPHREGPGVTIAVRTRVYGIPVFTERLEVLDWDPPRRLVIAHRSFVGGTGTWSLEPVASGTRFTWTEDLTLPLPVVGELALRVYRPFMRSLMGKAMGDLRAFLIATGPLGHSGRA
jgi:carbon monoxide dehydrogenase subunit G